MTFQSVCNFTPSDAIILPPIPKILSSIVKSKQKDMSNKGLLFLVYKYLSKEFQLLDGSIAMEYPLTTRDSKWCNNFQYESRFYRIWISTNMHAIADDDGKKVKKPRDNAYINSSTFYEDCILRNLLKYLQWYVTIQPALLIIIIYMQILWLATHHKHIYLQVTKPNQKESKHPL